MSVTPLGMRARQGASPDPAARRSEVRTRTALLLLATFLIATCGSPRPAGAAALLDVRIGKHEGYTRIVLDLDEGVTHRMERIETERGAVLIVTLDATASRRVIAPDAPLLRLVRIEPQEKGSIVRVAATTADVDVKVFALREPNRLVLDLRPRKAPTTTAARPPEAPLEAEKKPAPRVAKPAPPPALKADARPRPEPTARAKPPAPTPKEAVARASAADAKMAKPPADPSVQARTAVRVPPVPDAKTGARPGGSAPGATAPESRVLAEPNTAQGADAPRAERRSAPPPTPSLGRIGAPEEHSAGLAGIRPLYLYAAAAFALLLVGVTVARLRARRVVTEEGDLFEPDEAGGVAAGPTLAGPSGGPMPAAEERVGLPVPPPKDEDLPGVRGGEDAGLREMGRRLQVAENRLDEVTDARDRLERQMSAQAEELRVQRAAIARVQRVLRTLARPDEATEPAPRDPNRGPAG